MTILRLLLALALALCPSLAFADSFLHTDGTGIVDGRGRSVTLRGLGLGGWLLQEGYMLQMDGAQQHVVRRRIAELIGEKKTEAFYRAWWDNYITKADIDYMAAAGFNSVRLPMHFDQLTLPIAKEPRPGVDTWNEEGFARIDRLVSWVKANDMVLILDLHAAPGGQGTDLPIADRDASTPSLWDSAENRRKTVALWAKLAARYKDEPAVGAYDILNEPNWDFEKPGGGHGCQETRNVPLRALLVDITAAIRRVDKRHMIVVEGNCWGNNYAGMTPLWDTNMALSFHKYWNRNDAASLEPILKLRDDNHVPVWLGETGENSNVWFRDVVRLVEDHGIGWAFWPLKKIGFNNPLEVTPSPGWPKLVAYWTGKGPRPSAREAEATLMRLATHDIRFENNVAHPDVIDAMFRQPWSNTTLPFAANRIDAGGGTIRAVDYDLGRAGYAYSDRDDANYHVATGAARTEWNTGRTYRNDGVDIARAADGSAYVDHFGKGEWMRYTVTTDRAGVRDMTIRAACAGNGTVALTMNDGTPVVVAVAGSAWSDTAVGKVTLLEGRNMLLVEGTGGECRVETIRFTRR